MKKLIKLEIKTSDQGYTVKVEVAEVIEDVGEVAYQPICAVSGSLPTNEALLERNINFWDTEYAQVTEHFSTYKIRLKKLKEVSFKEVNDRLKELISNFNDWLDYPNFKVIVEVICKEIRDSEENRILFITNDLRLQKLPWHKVAFLDRSSSILSFGSDQFEKVSFNPRGKSRFLVLLGYEATTTHAQTIKELEDRYKEQLEFVWRSPKNLEELADTLSDPIGWDILLFIGHGRSADQWQTGKIQIATDLEVSISDLKSYLQQAIKLGLRLVILNCCDGLGLAYQLGAGEKLHLPHTVVMQDLFPVAATPKFLEYFLGEFTNNKSLHSSLNTTLHFLEKNLEKDFPCISLLPYLCENPAAKPLRFIELSGLPDCPYLSLEHTPLREEGISLKEAAAVVSATANQLGVYLENGLIDLICTEIGAEKSLLPIQFALLHHVLHDLWADAKSRKEIRLTIRGYQELGLAKILSNYSAMVYQILLPEYGEKRLKRIFTQLIDPQVDGEDTIRSATLEEIGEEHNSNLLQSLYRYKLITIEEEVIGLIHEGVAQQWQQLQVWIDADMRSFLLRLKQLRTEVRKWENNNRDRKYLLQGSSLEDVKDFVIKPELTLRQREFINLGIQERDRRKKLTIAGLIGGLVASFLLLGTATYQWQRAERQRLISESESLAFNALRQFESGKGEIDALILALQSANKLRSVVGSNSDILKYPTTEPLYALQQLTNNIRERNKLKGHVGKVADAKFIPGTNQIVSAGTDATIRIWDYQGNEIRKWNHPEGQSFEKIAISPDGSKLATISDSDFLIGKTFLWDIKSGKIISKLERYEKLSKVDKPVPITNFSDSIAFSPDGKLIATTRSPKGVDLFDSDGKHTAFLPGNTFFKSLSFTPDGKLLTGSGSHANIGKFFTWNIEKRVVINQGDLNVTDVYEGMYSPNSEEFLLIGTTDNGESTRPNTVAIIYPNNNNNNLKNELIGAVAGSFHPSERLVALGFGDGTNQGIIRLFDFSGNELMRLGGGGGSIIKVAFSSDGERLVSVNQDGIRLWDLSSKDRIWVAHELGANDYGFSSDSNKLVTASSLPEGLAKRSIATNGFIIWDVLSSKKIKEISADKSFANASKFLLTKDGNHIVGIVNDTASKYNILGELISQIKLPVQKDSFGHFQNYLTGVLVGYRHFSTTFDGSKIVTSWNIPTVWDFKTGKTTELSSPFFPLRAYASAISPKGDRVVTIDAPINSALLWDTSGKLLKTLTVPRKPLEAETIGVILSKNSNRVARVIEESPAARSGITAQDSILSIRHLRK